MGVPAVVEMGVATLATALAFVPHRKAYDPIKRIVDLVLSITASILSAPIILAAAIAIKLDSKGPVFYFANRVGTNGRSIKVWKLRTMVPDADRHGTITSGNDNRITRVGRLLRVTKIDELPQLFNILTGTMSIVGPRPESTNIVERYYSREDYELFEIAPGLTCPGTLYYYIYEENNEPPSSGSVEEYYAQVSLRTKLAADLHYVRNRRLAYDVKLIFLTIFIVMSKLFDSKITWLPENMRTN